MTISAHTTTPTTTITPRSLPPQPMASCLHPPSRPPPKLCFPTPLPLPLCPRRWSRPRGRGDGHGSTGHQSKHLPPRKLRLRPIRRGRSSSSSRGSVAALPLRPLLPTWGRLRGSPSYLAQVGPLKLYRRSVPVITGLYYLNSIGSSCCELMVLNSDWSQFHCARLSKAFLFSCSLDLFPSTLNTGKGSKHVLRRACAEENRV